jgi:hypothetical protein
MATVVRKTDIEGNVLIYKHFDNVDKSKRFINKLTVNNSECVYGYFLESKKCFMFKIG